MAGSDGASQEERRDAPGRGLHHPDLRHPDLVVTWHRVSEAFRKGASEVLGYSVTVPRERAAGLSPAAR